MRASEVVEERRPGVLVVRGSRRTGYRVGMMRMTTQAPSLNLVRQKTTVTRAVQTAPNPLTTIFAAQPFS
jgi:hypothetical protein